MPVVQLTQSFVNNLSVLPGKDRTEYCCNDTRGLYVEARKTSPNEGTFYVRYKNPAGKTKHLRLGRTNELSLTEARRLARDKQTEIRHGADPSLDRKKKLEIPTLQFFVEHHYLPYVQIRK